MGSTADASVNGHARPDPPPADSVAAKLASSPRQKKGRSGNSGKRATTAEVEERIIVVARLLAAHMHKHQVKQVLKAKYGLGARSTENYVARAREWLLKQTKRPRQQFVAEAVGFYEDIIRNPESSFREKMDAQAGLRELLGLDQPFKIAPTNTEGESALLSAQVVQNMTLEELAVLRSLHLRAQAAKAATFPVADHRPVITATE